MWRFAGFQLTQLTDPECPGSANEFSRASKPYIHLEKEMAQSFLQPKPSPWWEKDKHANYFTMKETEKSEQLYA